MIKDKLKHIKLIIQYEGSNYSGWQTQRNEKTIQGLIEDALFIVTKEHERVIGAGRTDAGVHALEQVAVFKTQTDLEPLVFVRALNSNLPHDIRVIHATECVEDFHPRYSAKSKTYSYNISNTGAYAVFLKRYTWQIHNGLDYGLMKEAAHFLIGKHDFSCFRASGCGSTNPVRTVSNIKISEISKIGFMGFTFDVPVIKLSIQADAFLRHMARNIVGALVEVGKRKTPPLKIKEILESKDRRLSGRTAPAQGLFLEKIEY